MTVYEVKSGVVSSGIHVDAGDLLAIERGGEADGSVISGLGVGGPSGNGIMSDFGIARNTLITAGGQAIIYGGGVAYGTIVDEGGSTTISQGGAAFGTVLRGGMQVSSGGYTSGTIVSAGGGEGILSGGWSIGTIVLSGGAEGLASGTTHRTVVSSGGNETVFAGATSSTTISQGGLELVEGGHSLATRILSGGNEQITEGGAASGSLVSAGGQEIVSSGGIADATQIYKGGTLTVSSGGAVSGGLTFHAGSAIIDGSVGAGTVRFAGVVGTLDLNDVADFHAAISGFKGATEKLDIGGFGFLEGETVSWKQLGTSGTLTIKGDEIAKLTLIGQYTASDFKLANDFHDGTYVKYLPPASAATAPGRFAEAMAGFSGRAGAGMAVHSGGSAVTEPALITAVSSGH